MVRTNSIIILEVETRGSEEFKASLRYEAMSL